MALRMVAMVAMVSMGAMRLATQAYSEQAGPRKPISKCLRDAFESLKSEL